MAVLGIRKRVVALVALVSFLAIDVVSATPKDDPSDRREKAEAAFEKGLYRGAYVIYRALALDPKDEPKQVAADFSRGVDCLRELKLDDAIVKFREQILAVHGDNWSVVANVARSIREERFDDTSRKPLEALRLLYRAVELIDREQNPDPAAARVLFEFANAFEDRPDPTHWLLTRLTDLNGDPKAEAEALSSASFHRPDGAAVDDRGEPIFHRVPKSLAEAKTDGERWRWAFKRSSEIDPRSASSAKFEFAKACEDMYGTKTLAHVYPPADDDPKFATGPLALQTLSDDETIARLADGVRRFKLPDEFNYIKIYKELEDDPRLEADRDEPSDLLAEEYDRRRQFAKEAEVLKAAMKRFGTGPEDYRAVKLKQIEGNWGVFEQSGVQRAGRPATVQFRFRNAREATFVVRPIRFDVVLDRIRARILEIKYEDMKLAEYGVDGIDLHDRIDEMVVNDADKERYLAGPVAIWDLKLDPAADHFDKTITVKTPLEKPGLYLLTVRLHDARPFHVILQIVDTVAVLKRVGNEARVFVVDADDGHLIVGAKVEAFAHRETMDDKGNVFENKPAKDDRRIIRTSLVRSILQTDRDGFAVLDAKDFSGDLQMNLELLVRGPGERFARLKVGQLRPWLDTTRPDHQITPNLFIVTDRPIYRPGQSVKFKLWLRQEEESDRGSKSKFAGKKVVVQIASPKHESIFKKEYLADDLGGVDGEMILPKNADLGRYDISVQGAFSMRSFQVEEYKKPEFEVAIDSPREPVKLGDKFKVKIKARYYFGGPVARGKVHVGVDRAGFDQTWYPVSRWDWLFHRGYGLTKDDRLDRYYLTPWMTTRPEEIISREEILNADGTVEVEIDTSKAKQIHGNQDHRYTITAEIIDESRRIVSGSEEVVVTRDPFHVFVGLGYGFYSVGEDIKARILAQGRRFRRQRERRRQALESRRARRFGQADRPRDRRDFVPRKCQRNDRLDFPRRRNGKIQTCLFLDR